MIDKLIDNIEAHHVWRFIFVLLLAEIISAVYLLIYLWRILEK